MTDEVDVEETDFRDGDSKMLGSVLFVRLVALGESREVYNEGRPSSVAIVARSGKRESMLRRVPITGAVEWLGCNFASSSLIGTSSILLRDLKPAKDNRARKAFAI